MKQLSLTKKSAEIKGKLSDKKYYIRITEGSVVSFVWFAKA
jgi:hypothetical protein